MGNLDPIEVLLKGTPKTIAAEVERIMAVGCQGTGYMFDLGERTPRDVPAANMRAMIRKARELGVPA